MSDDTESHTKTEEPPKKRRPSKKQRDEFGYWLIEEVRRGADHVVKKLIEGGANVNVQDERGMTALHYAASNGARPCLRLLVSSGRCDYLIKDNRNLYAFELAIEWGKDYAVARLLGKKQRQQALKEGKPIWDKGISKKSKK